MIPSILAAVIAAVSAFLVARYGKKNSKELEEIKKDFNQNLYVFQKEHDKKFEAKIELWNKLAELEGYIADLWSDNAPRNRGSAKKALREASINLRRSQIFIDHSLYLEIKKILEIFGKYTDGKESLDELYMRVNDNSIKEIIEQNRSYKNAYENMLNKLKSVILDRVL